MNFLKMNTNKFGLFCLLLLMSLSSLGIATAQSNQKPETAKKNSTIPNAVHECKQHLEIGEILIAPEKWLNKEVCFEGKFSAFSNLALDYPPAMRSHRDYISLTLFRPNTKIPLSELKLAIKIDYAQKHEMIPNLKEGDLVKIKGKVFSAALGEPWLDILELQAKQLAENSSEEEDVSEL